MNEEVAKNLKNSEQVEQATILRIQEEMGNPVTFASFQSFKENVNQQLQFLLNQPFMRTDKALKKIIHAIIDLFKAINMIQDAKISEDIRSELQNMKSSYLNSSLKNNWKEPLRQYAV